MYYIVKLTKKTRPKEKLQLRYEFFLWNRIYGLCNEVMTHRLDYIPEDWVITNFSILQTHMVYDSATITSLYLYLDPVKVFLKIKEMYLDLEEFPYMERTRSLFLTEYIRVRLLQKCSKILIKRSSLLEAPNLIHNLNSLLFLKSNFSLFLRSLLARKVFKLYKNKNLYKKLINFYNLSRK